MKILSPFQEKLIKLRFQGLSYEQISEVLNRDYGTVRNDFSRIYRVLEIKLTCQLPRAHAAYKERLREFINLRNPPSTP